MKQLWYEEDVDTGEEPGGAGGYAAGAAIGAITAGLGSRASLLRLSDDVPRGGLGAGAKPTRTAFGLDDALEAPEGLLGQVPSDLRPSMNKNWIETPLGQGSHAGQGSIFRQLDSDGAMTGRMVQWHPGGGHHGPWNYWKVSSGEAGIRHVGWQFNGVW